MHLTYRPLATIAILLSALVKQMAAAPSPTNSICPAGSYAADCNKDISNLQVAQAKMGDVTGMFLLPFRYLPGQKNCKSVLLDIMQATRVPCYVAFVGSVNKTCQGCTF